MSIVDIKKRIGQRILEARKFKNLTRKALADLTTDLNQSSINNWERGERTPGPEEVLQLGKVLDISASYLMCLTDQKHSDPLKMIPGLGSLIPLLNVQNAIDPKEALRNCKIEDITFVSLGKVLSAQLSKNAFALKMQDDSMSPELNPHDILIVDPHKLPQPGQFVVAHIRESKEVIIRRYKQISSGQPQQQFELIAANKHWADVKDSSQCQLIGTIYSFIRILHF